jgi:hypothetical protein
METVRIRDPGWEKSRIRDKHPGSATLPKSHLDIGDEREFLHHILHDQPRLVLHVLLYLENRKISVVEPKLFISVPVRSEFWQSFGFGSRSKPGSGLGPC